ncbi:MAG: class B sortase [Oscillospiraceae bacterium]|nr:class B sortase [Oscillospiraceae bacterium]
MSAARTCVRLINSFVSLVVLLAILLFGAYSMYSLWDNNQVYRQAENVQMQMKELKPVLSKTADGGVEVPSFDDLLAVNPDVRAWLTMDGTNIDFPVLQGTSNLTYINKDVYGNFALAGSIFLDCGNAPDFSDTYNLVYGHHMSNSNMFGDLDLYRQEKFFRETDTGLLMTRGAVYGLKVVALVIVSASDENIFEVRENQDADELLAFIRSKAIFVSDSLPETGEDAQFLALSTCSADFSDSRTVVITQMFKH